MKPHPPGNCVSPINQRRNVSEDVTLIFGDFPLAAGEIMIVTRQKTGKFLGHTKGYSDGVEHVYVDASILNLKYRWESYLSKRCSLGCRPG